MILKDSFDSSDATSDSAIADTGSKVTLCKIFKYLPSYSVNTGKSDNAIIQGDNLAALTLLAKNFANTVKCAYLDPPYNNGESYQHYFDNMGHEEWLNSVTERLKLVKELLRDDGSVWISIDDSELHYLKVVADQIFGRKNFAGTIVWERRTTRENRKVFSRNHEYILIYTKKIEVWTKSRNSLPITDSVIERYKNIDNDKRGPWQSVSANVQEGHATAKQYYTVTGPSGKLHHPPKGRCWLYTEEKMLDEIKANNIWFGKDGNSAPRLKKFLAERKVGLTPETLWKSVDVGTTTSAKKHLLDLFKETTLFDTPKPEELIKRILEISTNEGDLVLDPYLGSGTTTAVAHKMNRCYWGIEKGDHVKTHCVERLKKVIAGEQLGISKQVNWKGGGSFAFYRIG